ncbi:DUF2231 domain-containing protein [Baekduia sp.]|jgi:uncharacterized membrane protein|uniref:DUF2231 domain-containing protein n=1 Tax=Baekduia sp. TaxID=2600305 RepID=UPI002E017D8B|nr:DUF2231 domain-containing protein [Baekduia sp.]
MDPQDLTGRIEASADLDNVSASVGALVRSAVRPGPVKDALQGTWMGHALHPLLTDMVIGAWTSGLLLDLTGGRGGDRLVAAGIVCAVPTALTGATDWADVETRDPAARRVGIVHGLANAAALGLQLGSLVARGRGKRARGVALSVAANGLLGASGYLGGHLSYVRGVGIGAREPGGSRP